MRVMKATDMCSSVGDAGELHGALRDQKCEGKATGLSRGKFSLIYLRFYSKCSYKYYIVRVCEVA